MVQVSAGYDAHTLDPLEQLNYQSATYHALVSSLMSLADKLSSESFCLPACSSMLYLMPTRLSQSRPF